MCRFCEHSAPQSEMVKYGTRHYAHAVCLYQRRGIEAINGCANILGDADFAALYEAIDPAVPPTIESPAVGTSGQASVAPAASLDDLLWAARAIGYGHITGDASGGRPVGPVPDFPSIASSDFRRFREAIGAMTPGPWAYSAARRAVCGSVSVLGSDDNILVLMNDDPADGRGVALLRNAATTLLDLWEACESWRTARIRSQYAGVSPANDPDFSQRAFKDMQGAEGAILELLRGGLP